MRRQLNGALVSAVGVAATTLLLRASGSQNPTTAALAFLLVVLFVAAFAELWTAIAISVAATLCFNYFFLPPIGTFSIADPHNWVALFAFLVVSMVASRLSTSARTRARDALD